MGRYREDRDRSLDEPTLLLVHSFGGMPPEDMLGGEAVLVGGSDDAGFFRLRDPSPAQEGLEAYSWTSTVRGGSLVNVLLHIVLLPFILINAGGWMLPPPRRRSGDASGHLYRALALFSTVVFALVLGAILVDLVALQCGASEACAGGHWWLQWLNHGSYRFVQGRPAGLMAVALLAVMGILAVPWRATLPAPGEPRRPDDYAVARSWEDDAGDWVLPPGMPNLVRTFVWDGGKRMALARLHLASAFAALGAAYASTVLWLGHEHGQFMPFTGIAVVYCVAMLQWNVWLARSHIPADRPTWYALRVSTIILLGALAAGWLEGPTWSEASGATASDVRGIFNVVALVFGAEPLFLLLGLSGIALAANSEWRSRYGRPWIAAFGGLSLGTVMLATFAVALGAALEGGHVVADVPGVYGSLVTLILVVAYAAWLMLAVSAFRTSPVGDTEERAIAEEHHADLVQLGERRSFEEWMEVAAGDDWFESQATARARAQTTVSRMRRLFTVLAAVLLLWWTWAVIDVVLVLLTDISSGFATGVVARTGPLVVVPLLATAVALVPRAYKNEDLRRRLGVLLEALTFWPRSFHPFVPASYGVASVPQLQERLERRLPGRVVISAHGQGALLALATLVRMSGTARADLGLLTYGNTRRLYHAFYPHYFGDDEMAKAAALLTDDRGTRWRNLYRCTDPLGGWVKLGERDDDPCRSSLKPERADPPSLVRPLNDVDWLVPDPFPRWPEVGDPLPPIRGHADYDLDPPYNAAVEELFAMVGVPQDTPETGV